jgi:hypothetical protein
LGIKKVEKGEIYPTSALAMGRLFVAVAGGLVGWRQ